MNAPVRSLAVLLALVPAAGTARGQGEDAPLVPQTVPLAHVARVFDRAGREVTFDDMLAELSAADAVFLGETHLDDVTHRVEHAIFAGLADRRAGKVALTLEMFERDVQPVLDRYLAGEIDEPTFLATSRPWANYHTGYRALVEEAKRRGLPVYGANIPAMLRTKLSRGRQAAFDALSAEERAHVPERLFPNSEAYWERFDHLMKDSSGHAMAMPADSRLFMGQSLWDNTMGDTCAVALARHAGFQVVHVAGGFHVGGGLGTVEQFLRRAEGATARVVQIGTTFDLASASRREAGSEGSDYVVFAEARANGPSRGRIAVHVPGEIGYRFDLPEGAPPAAGFPLFVWLHDRGARTDDERAYWTRAFEGEAAVAVVEPLYPEPARDLAESGRWSHGSRRDDDRPRVRVALERLAEHLVRTYPIDPRRIVVAGEGEGGAMVLPAALETARLGARFLVVEPHPLVQYIAPFPKHARPAARHVRILDEANRANVAKWNGRFEEAGISVQVTPYAGRPSLERAVRELAGLAPAAAAGAELAAETTRVLWLSQGGARARTFADVLARAASRAGERCVVLTPADRPRFEAFLASRPADAAPIALQPLAIDDLPDELAGFAHPGLNVLAPFDASTFASGKALPVVDAPFGGTTVLVLPGTTSAEKRQAWFALEGRGTIGKRHRFANLRVAFAVEEPSLASVLGELVQGGETDLLVVPALFCADERAMQALLELARPVLGTVEPLWVPGLGAELYRATSES